MFPARQQEDANSRALLYEYEDHQEYSTDDRMTAVGVAPMMNPAFAGSNPNSCAYKPDVGATTA